MGFGTILSIKSLNLRKFKVLQSAINKPDDVIDVTH